MVRRGVAAFDAVATRDVVRDVVMEIGMGPATVVAPPRAEACGDP